MHHGVVFAGREHTPFCTLPLRGTQPEGPLLILHRFRQCKIILLHQQTTSIVSGRNVFASPEASAPKLSWKEGNP